MNHCRLILLVGPNEEDLVHVKKEEVGIQLHERLDNRFGHEDALESSLVQPLDEGKSRNDLISKLLNEFDALVTVLEGEVEVEIHGDEFLAVVHDEDAMNVEFDFVLTLLVLVVNV